MELKKIWGITENLQFKHYCESMGERMVASGILALMIGCADTDTEPKPCDTSCTSQMRMGMVLVPLMYMKNPARSLKDL